MNTKNRVLLGGVVLVLICTSIGVASAKTWYVDTNGGPGINFTEIQEAVDVASNGDTIYVYAGKYCENVVINKGLKLIGEDKNTTTIWRSGGTIVNITSDNVTLSGFAIKVGSRGISCCSNNVIITNNTILSINGVEGRCRSDGGDGVGIKFISSTNVSIYNNTISSISGGKGGDCSVYCPEIRGKGKGGDGYGIMLSSSDDIAIAGNTISSIEGGKGGLGGFRLVCNRPGSGGDGYGIFISSSTDIITLRNNISSAGGNGGVCGDINCWGSSRGGDGYGIYISSANSTIFNNIISDVKGGLGFENNANEPPYTRPHLCGRGYKGYDNSIGGNAWDKGPRIGGNYWNSSCKGNPSNGSQPYNIYGNAGAQDHHPFEDPDGWIKSPIWLYNKQYAILNSTYTADMYVWGDYHSIYVVPATEMMGELPDVYAYDLVNDSQIENGDLVSSGYKALMLPNAISLSDLECSQISNFVEQGGLIFATAQTSRYKPDVGWRSDFGLDCLGVTYKSDDEGHVWNMDIVENCSILLKGVFNKSESDDDIAICGSDFLVLVDLKPDSNINTFATLFVGINPAFSVQDLNAHFVSSRYVRETLKLLPQKPDPILIQERGCG